MLRRLRLTESRARRVSPKLLRCAILLALVGCSPDSAQEASDAKASPIWSYEREFPGGEHPASLVLRLSAVELGLADQLVLEQELRVQPGFVAEFPEYLPEDFEDFSVVSIDSGPSERAPKKPSNPDNASAGSSEASDPGAVNSSPGDAAATGTHAARRKRLLLEPNRSGELTIAALAVYFHGEEEAEESHFLTEEITVKVEAIEEFAQLETRPLRSIYQTPVDDDSSSVGRWVILALAVLGALGLLARKILQRPRKPAPETPAHEIAYEALRRLVGFNLPEKGEVELFFVHLSSILRTYIENRFHVHAPERTTEEFLAEASKHPALEMHRERLAEFLSLSDQVKFARYEPDEKHIQGAFDTLKQFVEETRQTEVTAAA